MNIEALKQYLEQNGHPNAIGPFGPVVLQDDGQGAYIRTWDLPIPQPTPEQLEQPE